MDYLFQRKRRGWAVVLSAHASGEPLSTGGDHLLSGNTGMGETPYTTWGDFFRLPPLAHETADRTLMNLWGLLSDGPHDFAELLVLLHVPVRLHDLFERERLCD